LEELFKNSAGEPFWETDIKKLREEREADRQMELDNWHNAFVETFCTTATGRKVLWFLMHESYVFRPFGGQNAAAYAKEGKRELGLIISEMLSADKLLESLIQVKNDELRRQKHE